MMIKLSIDSFKPCAGPYIIVTSPLASRGPMHVGNQMVSGTILQANMAATRPVIVEVKYISSKNVVIHSENCKVQIPVDIKAQQLSETNLSYDWHLRSK